jgi:hypothetical protein
MTRAETDAALIEQVARLFYEEQLTKLEIAARLGISRFRVARLIDRALPREPPSVGRAQRAGPDQRRARPARVLAEGADPDDRDRQLGIPAHDARDIREPEEGGAGLRRVDECGSVHPVMRGPEPLGEDARQVAGVGVGAEPG